MQSKNLKYLLWFSIILILSVYGTATSARLDLNVNTSVKGVYYSAADFASQKPSDAFFYLQDAKLAITLKNITPDKKKIKETSVDMGLVLHGLGISGSTNSITQQPFNLITSRYPSSNFMPFIEQAYVKINKIFDTNINICAGRQSFILGNGLALSDDGLGFAGLQIKIEKLLKNTSLQVFTFQPKPKQPASGEINILGTELEFLSEGVWKAYTFWEIDKNTPLVNSMPVNSVTRHFSGISYLMRYRQLFFSGEAAIQKGSTSNSNVNFNGSAISLSGKWIQDTKKFGKIAGRISFGKASGDKASTLDDEAFFPSFGHRYKGLERSGFGEILGASLYDAQGGTSATKTGLPAGLSGIEIYNMGITLPPIAELLYFDIDFYSFEASNSTAGKKIGNEWDFKLSSPLSKDINMNAIFAMFSPGNAYSNTNPVKKISFEISAGF